MGLQPGRDVTAGIDEEDEICGVTRLMALQVWICVKGPHPDDPKNHLMVKKTDES